MQTGSLQKREDNVEEKKMKNECSCEGTKHIKGIVCDVQNCAYHNGKSECYAGSICIGPCEADCSANTVCATFKPREY